MRILISGATGFIGRRLATALLHTEHDVYCLSRKKIEDKNASGCRFISWNPERKILDPSAIEGIEAVFNLAGDNIGSGYWGAKKKNKILLSRVDSTELLVKTIEKLSQPPKVFISASAVGYYGDTGDSFVDENSPPGKGFLAQVCQAWEQAAYSLNEKNVRVVFSRFGMVLSSKEGALAKMLTPFKLGLGGKLGSGKQYISWISIQDTISALIYCLENDLFSGPVNLVSPEPISNATWTSALGDALNRPTFFSVPQTILQIFLGEMAKELLLSSIRVKPNKLLAQGYRFQHTEIRDTLEQMIAEGQ